MALNPLDANHRQRLAKAVSFSHREIDKFNALRATTIQAYLGISPDIHSHSFTQKKQKKKMPQGNLLQMGGLAHQISLAFGEPRVTVNARTPENAGLADKLGPALNRYATLVDLGETHRNVAADSYFGYGIYKTGVGFLPPAAQVATGLEVGPCIWRVSQKHFLYDITADSWNKVAYAGDIYSMDLEDAQNVYPESADRLRTFTDANRLDSRTVLPRPTTGHSAEQLIWLVDLYFPQAGVIATWPVNADSFGHLEAEPIAVREYEGHWSGVYQVLNHLYSPDELVPVSQAESVKSLHFLFNDLLSLTSEQARNAKQHTLFQAGAFNDMKRIWDAKDRHPVSVQDPSRFAPFEIPGPSQSQTAYMSAMFNFFRELTPVFDQPQRAPTATQGELVRETTNAIIAEARRKDIRALQLVYYKLGHLMLNTNDLVLPATRPLRPGSQIPLDVTFSPDPTDGKIDDVDIQIDPFSIMPKFPEQKIAQITQAMQNITQAMQLAAQGAPINVEEVIALEAEYRDLPELRKIYEPADPLFQAKRQQSQQSAPRLGVGQYVRHNVSEKTTAGQLEKNLNQDISNNGQQPPQAG